jgi:glycosyltransferase involved in cell wall biosynthesis
VDVLLVSSRFYGRKFAEWGYDPAKIVYVPNYASAIGLSPATQAGEGVAYFGRLSEEKGIATLIRAAALSGVPTTVIGTGPQEATLKALAAELGAPVTFTGRLDGEALWSAVKSVRATVLPSEWYENGPMSVFESYGNARMVIGADIAGIPELIEEGVSGWTFPSGDVGALAERLAAVAGLPETRVMEMGREGLRIVGTVFTRARYLDEITTAYNRAMAA